MLRHQLHNQVSAFGGTLRFGVPKAHNFILCAFFMNKSKLLYIPYLFLIALVLILWIKTIQFFGNKWGFSLKLTNQSITWTIGFSHLEIINNNIILVKNGSVEDYLTNDWTTEICDDPKDWESHEMVYSILSKSWDYGMYKKEDHYCEADRWNISYIVVNLINKTSKQLNEESNTFQYIDKINSDWYYIVSGKDTDIDLWADWYYDSQKLREDWYFLTWDLWIKKINFQSLFN